MGALHQNLSTDTVLSVNRTEMKEVLRLQLVLLFVAAPTTMPSYKLSNLPKDTTLTQQEDNLEMYEKNVPEKYEEMGRKHFVDNDDRKWYEHEDTKWHKHDNTDRNKGGDKGKKKCKCKCKLRLISRAYMGN